MFAWNMKIPDATAFWGWSAWTPMVPWPCRGRIRHAPVWAERVYTQRFSLRVDPAPRVKPAELR